MREFYGRRQTAEGIAAECGLTYDRLKKEAFPPLADLELEHQAMVRQRLRQEHEQARDFSNTMAHWAARARKDG
jgi:hypothetical protein